MRVYGQKELLTSIDALIANNKFPAVTLIIGKVNSGKKTLAAYIGNKLGIDLSYIDNKIDDIRDMLLAMGTNDIHKIFVVKDIESMSIGAKNSLLKVCEEPPKNKHIILLANDEQGVLETLKSRAITLRMQPYTKEDYNEYIKENNITSPIDFNYIENIYELESLKNNLHNYTEFCIKIQKSFKSTSLANLLKSASYIAFKAEDEDKMDFNIILNILLKLFSATLLNNKNIIEKREFIDLLLDCKAKLNNKSIKKSYLYDHIIIRGYQLSEYLCS